MMDLVTTTLESLGNVANWIDQQITTMLTKVITPAVASVTAQILPFVSVCLSISLMWYGWLICTGTIQTPVFDALKKSVSILTIVSIAGAGGLYQTQIMGAMLDLPKDLSQIITGERKTAAQIVDDAANKGSTIGTRLRERAPSGLSHIPEAVIFAVVALIIVVCSAIISGLGVLALIITKVGMGLVVTLGPLCILALLFEKTQTFFTAWMHQAVHYAIHAGVYLLVFTMIMDMFRVLQAACLVSATANEMNIFSILIAIVLFLFCAKAMLELVSDVVSGISGAVGGSYNIPKIGKIG